MIRQAISCDICGAEKKQTNHWFVVYEQAGELRVSGWSSRNRLKADSKHLCGQACLHKLADDFMARVISEKAAARPQPVAEEMAMEPATEKRTAATSGAAVHGRASAPDRPIAQVRPPTREFSPAHPRPAARGDAAAHDHAVVRDADPEFDPQVDLETESSARLIAPAKPVLPPLPAQPATALVPMPERVLVPLPADPPRYASRRWHTEAWERERERSLRSGDHRSEHATRRSSQA